MSSAEDSKPFLADDADETGYDSPSSDRFTQHQKRPVNSAWRKCLWAAHAFFFALNLAFLTYNIGDVGEHIAPDQSVLNRAYSPARDGIQYTVKEETAMLSDNLLVGPPTPEADQAWEELEKPFMLRISKDEMDRMGKTSLALKDGSGYIGYLETFHMLHCIKSLWKSQHTDHYGSGHTTQPGHLSHCLNVLLQGIMCNADTMIGTYHWAESGAIKGKEMKDIEVNRTGHRQCTDFSKLQSWAKARTLDFDIHDTDKFLRTLEPELEL